MADSPELKKARQDLANAKKIVVSTGPLQKGVTQASSQESKDNIIRAIEKRIKKLEQGDIDLEKERKETAEAQKKADEKNAEKKREREKEKTGIAKLRDDPSILGVATKVVTSPVTTAALLAVLSGVGAVGAGLVGAKIVAGAGVAIGMTVAGGSGIYTWLASDNITSGMLIWMNQIKSDVTFNDLSISEAMIEVEKAQFFVNEARIFINANTMLNPVLWPFRGIILTHVESAQNVIDYNKRIIPTITPSRTEDSTNPEGSGKTDDEWNEIFEENVKRKEREREIELAQIAEDEARWKRIKEENAAAKEAERISDEEIRALEDEYWVGVETRKIARDTAAKLAEGAYWDSIREGATTVEAIRAGETARGNFLATGELPQTATAEQPTTQQTATETPLEEQQPTTKPKTTKPQTAQQVERELSKQDAKIKQEKDNKFGKFGESNFKNYQNIFANRKTPPAYNPNTKYIKTASNKNKPKL